MRPTLKLALFWGSVGAGFILIYYFFTVIIGMPIAALITFSLVGTWTLPRPWRFLLALAIFGEIWAVTPPLSVTIAVGSPLLLWWLRGRVEIDISFLYSFAVAASAALGLLLASATIAYPVWQSVPWLIVLVAWCCVTVISVFLTLVLPSLHSRFLHGRYF